MAAGLVGSGGISSGKRSGILVYCRAACAPPTHPTTAWVTAAFQWFRTLAVTHEFCDPVRRKANSSDTATLKRLLHPSNCTSAQSVGGVWGDWGVRDAPANPRGGFGPPPGRFTPLPAGPSCACCGSREGQVGADGKMVQLSVCSGCGKVALCGMVCQRAFWLARHSRECGGNK